MSWWQISAIAAQAHVATVEDALLAAGAAAVTLRDAGDDPQFEPLPGEQPLWPNTKLSGLFALEAKPQAVVDALARDAQISAEIEPLPERDWEREWLKHFRPLKFGGRLWIEPTGLQCAAAPDDIIIQLDPGLAFGTGTHPTTALCLDWLAENLTPHSHWIDYGCGSGILAVAAAKLGAKQVEVLDIDPQALLATQRNAERNAVADHIRPLAVDAPLPRAEGLIANILAGPLIELAERLCSALPTGAPIVLSGILAEQGQSICAAYAPYCTNLKTTERDGWLRVAGTRH